MSLGRRLQRLIDYGAWADRRVGTALAGLQRPDAALLRLFAHIVTTERLYYERMTGKDPWPQDFWPELTLWECRSVADACAERYSGYLDDATDAELERPVTYRDSSGRHHQTAPVRMIEHVALHSAHHRGQIALELRRGGAEPPITDYIRYVREQE